MPDRKKKILKVTALSIVGCTGLITLFLNCSSSFTATSDPTYTQQVDTVDITISAQPTSATVMVGNTFSLSAVASGSSTLYYQWYKDGTAIDGAATSTYSITSIAATDAGAYCVIIWDESGSVISANATLTASANPNAPIIATQPVAVIGSVGGAASFTVTATGDTLTYQWYHNGVAVSGATASTLSIASITSDDAGTYDVIVTNSVTSVTSSEVTLSIVAGT